MSRPEKKKRVETDGSQRPLAGLGHAFSGLPSPSLPAETPAPAKVPAEWKLGRVTLRRETAHRGGKTVVVIYDFATHLPMSVIESTAKKLRAACGTGGTVKGRTIEIQGDQPAKIRTTLEAEGYRVAGV